MLNHLEIKFEKNIETGNYRATCVEFPNCEGIGSTQDLALKALGKSMIKILMGSMETMMTNLLFKNNFTEIILDTTESKTVQKRIYSLDPRVTKANKSVLVQLDKFSTTNPEQTELSDIVNLMQKETVSVSHLLKSQLRDESSAIQTLEQLLQQDDADGFAFGFPISFN